MKNAFPGYNPLDAFAKTIKELEKWRRKQMIEVGKPIDTSIYPIMVEGHIINNDTEHNCLLIQCHEMPDDCKVDRIMREAPIYVIFGIAGFGNAEREQFEEAVPRLVAKALKEATDGHK